jgi:hypothetical protein
MNRVSPSAPAVVVPAMTRRLMYPRVLELLRGNQRSQESTMASAGWRTKYRKLAKRKYKADLERRDLALKNRELRAALQGREWRGLRAVDILSVVPPDPDNTYFVRINDDGTFTVGLDGPNVVRF